MNPRKRLILGLGSVVGAIMLGSLILSNAIGASQTMELMYETDGPSFNDVTDLTKASHAVAHVRVLSAGQSYLIPFDTAVPQVAPVRKDDGSKGKAGEQTTAIPVGLQTPKGILKTDFTVEVLDNIHGANIRKGEHLIVSQLGGKSADGKVSTVAEHDPLMQMGAEEIVFLNQDSASGKFFTTGGGGGRFIVNSNGAVTPVQHDSPIGRIHTGRPASFLKSAVRAAQ
jgi:hypothetical protein